MLLEPSVLETGALTFSDIIRANGIAPGASSVALVASCKNNLLSAYSVPRTVSGPNAALGNKQTRVLRSPTPGQNPTCNLSGLTVANYKV